MLCRGCGPAKPSIVGDVDEELRAVARELPHLGRKNRFVTDKHSKATIRQLPNTEGAAWREIPDIRGEPSGKGKPFAVRHKLTERHQMDLIIRESSQSDWIEKDGAVGSRPAAGGEA